MLDEVLCSLAMRFNKILSSTFKDKAHGLTHIIHYVLLLTTQRMYNVVAHNIYQWQSEEDISRSVVLQET
jgi:hypothetical protein